MLQRAEQAAQVTVTRIAIPFVHGVALLLQLLASVLVVLMLLYPAWSVFSALMKFG